MNSRKKLVLIVAGVTAGVLLIAGITFSFRSSSSSKNSYRIVVSPSDSQLMVDGVSTTPGDVTLKPGAHTLKATRKDFDPDTKVINTKDLTPGQTIYMLPAPNSTAAQQWLLDHPEEQQEREAVSGAKAEQTIVTIDTKYPILRSLPYITLDFRVDYSMVNDSTASFDVTLYPTADPSATPDDYHSQLVRYRQEALDYLKQNSVDSSNATITFSPDPDAPVNTTANTPSNSREGQ